MKTANPSTNYRRTAHFGSIVGIAAIALAGPNSSHVLAQTEPTPAQESVQAGTPRLRLRIAVDQFKWSEIRQDQDLPRDLKEGLQALLIQELQKSGRFQVMEREATARAQGNDEDEIAQQKRESLPEGSAANAVARQRRTPAQYIITPTVTGLQETSSGSSGIELSFLKMGGKKSKTTLSLNIRITDAETSETIYSFTAEGDSESKGSNLGITLGGITFGKSDNKQSGMSKVVGATLNDAVAKICSHLAKEPWYTQVAKQDQDTHRVVLAAGSEDGIETGMEFVVNQTGEVIRHPVTGDILSRGDETQIGRIRIVRVERGVSYADVVNGDGFKPGNMVRLPK